MVEQLTIKNLDHLGLIAGIIDDLEIENIVNSLIKTYQREKVSAGTIVKAIILNGLGYLSKPLYLFPEFFRDKPVEKLLGVGIKAEEINDDKIGRVMDELYEVSADKLWTEIGLNTLKIFEINTLYSHLDSSSISVSGEYNYQQGNEGDKILEITYGYSKDKRQDLKQFMIDLIVSNDGDIPLLMRVGNGNESDKKVFVELIKKYQENFDLETIYVADSALYTALNLAEMKKHNIRWLTRVPFNVKKAKELGTINKEKTWIKSDNLGYKYIEKKVNYHGIELRWLIIESENRKQSDLEQLEKRIETESKKIEKELKKLFGKESKENKEKDNPTLSWIFQLFQGIHLVEIEEREMVSNLTEEIRKILGYFSKNCQKYYIY